MVADIVPMEPGSFESWPFEPGLYRRRWKRRVDFFLSFILIFFFLIPLVLLSLFGFLQHGHRFLYSEIRAGLNGNAFRLYKFRTELRPGKKSLFGGLLSFSGLDELPQLFQVLFGTMSLVGPRPHSFERDQINITAIPSYSTRYAMRPGLTGLAQVRQLSDDRGDELRLVVASDIEYLERCSFTLDLLILLRTAWIPFRGH